MKGVRKIAGRAGIAMVALVTIFSSPAAALPGDPDPSFGGGDGIVTTNLTTQFDIALGVAVQDDGKIVVVGEAFGSGSRWFIARYTAAGALDPTFSGDGKAFLDWTNRVDAAVDLAIQEDGKIVVVGNTNDLNAFAMARFTAAGILDTTFSGDGKVSRNVGSALEFGYAVDVIDSGAIRVTGTGQGRITAFGYTTSGAPDTGWSGDGFTSVTFSGLGPGLGLDIVEDDAGRVLIAGSVGGAGAAAERSVVIRFNANGTPDTSFSGDGKTAINIVNGYEDAATVIPTATGVFVGGDANGRLSLFQLTAAGALDPTFSGDGKAIIDLPGSQEFVAGLVPAPAGGYTGAGRIGQGGGRGLFFQVTAAGTLDPTFSGNGWVAHNLSSREDIFTDMAVTPEGAILGAGGMDDAARVLLVRVEGNPL